MSKEYIIKKHKQYFSSCNKAKYLKKPYPTKVTKAKGIILLGTLCNILLVALKLTVGILSGSSALIADAVHSLSDVVHTLVSLFSISIAEKPADDGHNFGHGNAETLGALIVSTIMLTAGVFIMYEAINYLVKDFEGVKPEIYAVFIAGVTVIIKLVLSIITERASRKGSSPIVKTNAADHRQDALTSMIVVIALIGAELGLVWLDVVGAILIGFYIAVKSSLLIKENLHNILGGIPKDKTIADKIIKILDNETRIMGYHDVKLMQSGSWVHITIDIEMPKEMTVNDAHNIISDINLQIDKISDCIGEIQIHLDPWNGDNEI